MLITSTMLGRFQSSGMQKRQNSFTSSLPPLGIWKALLCWAVFAKIAQRIFWWKGGRRRDKGRTDTKWTWLPATGLGNEPELSELLPSSQGGANLDSRKQQKSSPSPIFASQRSPFPRKHQIIRLLEKKNISLLNLLISETVKLQFYPLEGGGGVFYKVLFWEALPWGPTP